ncbi:hypothetical protein [Klebsiella quasipneumoniae]|uniref:hypothetical protein n=1 Tax=Klebsiella quasipneumoniae TaxID=1463165 RepID=UPI00164B53AD|nr:hypothetical protein [Klebsiella quasipneumoniae]HBY2240698.1 hypothetical protein [Klebsiella pneumoniae]HCI5736465.1 hypothetical protein [Klebsiella variicola subsp. variicola]MBC5075719.1 hypothetical protein [Klebsiella quasipneumoniae]MBC5182389.1 hypothetical protein [Klebsiella quasipneumoniae]UAD17628.1 hypothetical protein K7176_18980 [Klebsiella quasipneumoniae]
MKSVCTPDKYTGIALPNSDLISAKFVCIHCAHNSENFTGTSLWRGISPDFGGNVKDANKFALTVIIIMMAVLLFIQFIVVLIKP